MVANYTATLRKRRTDDFTPGGVNNRRPDRAVIVYSNLIRRAFKNTVPIVLGGIEASLRRITHYDYWDDQLRAPILFDAKANYLLYGMADTSILQLAEALKARQRPRPYADYASSVTTCLEMPCFYHPMKRLLPINKPSSKCMRFFTGITIPSLPAGLPKRKATGM